MGVDPRRGSLASVVAMIWLAAAPAAFADTFEVTKRGDPAPGPCTNADCSLREAIRAANAGPGGDRVVLPSRRSYNLSQPNTGEDGALDGDLDITNDPLRLIHPGNGRATIDANGIDRAFEVFGGAPTTFRRLAITGGASSSDGYGGGIRSYADLRLIRSVVTRNAATNCGGGIHTQMGADLLLRRSRVDGNRANGDGGGISHSCFGGSGALRIENSVIANNVGDFDRDTLGRGGGMYVQTAGGIQSLITDSTVAFNRTGHEGGGFYTDLGMLRVVGSTVSGNRTRNAGGGVSVDGTDPLVMLNSTVTRNRSNSVGGGVHGDSGEIRLNAVTVARNRGNADGIGSEAGGGLYVGGIPFRVENSLIALNTLTALTPGDPPVANDCAGENPFVSLGQNLLSTRFLCDGFDAPSDRRRSNPKIGQLADNGGPTKTIALRRGSPAINKADAATSPNRDQRGIRRRNPDIGAFERR